VIVVGRIEGNAAARFVLLKLHVFLDFAASRLKAQLASIARFDRAIGQARAKPCY
jgi:hypothetical protein